MSATFERLEHEIEEACLKAYVDGARGAKLEAGHPDRLDATRAFWDAMEAVRSTLEELKQAAVAQ